MSKRRFQPTFNGPTASGYPRGYSGSGRDLDWRYVDRPLVTGDLATVEGALGALLQRIKGLEEFLDGDMREVPVFIAVAFGGEPKREVIEQEISTLRDDAQKLLNRREMWLRIRGELKT